MKKKLKWSIIIIVAVLAFLFIVGLVSGGTASNASPYTKVGLRKDFSQVFISATNPTSDSTPLNIAGCESNIIANVLVYVYYAYTDYKAGNITEKQFFEVMSNTKEAVNQQITYYNQSMKTVMANDYYFNDTQHGLSYGEKEADGSWDTDTVNYMKLQPLMIALAQKMYQSNNPDDIYNDLKQYGVYLEQGTFYFVENKQYGMDQINVNTFQPNWLLDNVYMTKESVQALYK